jgi:hypothetical protein
LRKLKRHVGFLSSFLDHREPTPPGGENVTAKRTATAGIERNLCLLAVWLAVALMLPPTIAGAQQFVRVNEGPHVGHGGWTFGVSWVDYDDDGFPDLHINNWVYGSSAALNHLYHNEGDGTYTRVNVGDLATDGNSITSAWGDFDNDGDLDAYVACPEQLNRFFINNGDATFTRVTEGPVGNLEEVTQEPSWVDFDNDGDLDLFVANHLFPGDPYTIVCALYANDGGSFNLLDNLSVGLIEDEGGSVAWCDYDNDGDMDVMWSRNQNTAVFFDNDGDGTFTQVTHNAIAQAPRKYHFNPADYDNDGDLDLYAGSAYPGPPILCENTGNGDFALVTGQEISSDVGYWTGGYWGDYDNDGYVDLVVTGHSYYEPYINRLYHNNGDGTFTAVLNEVVAMDVEPSSAVAWADHDRDGDLDLFVANVNDFNNTLYLNNGNGNAWIQIALTGTTSNRSAIGAKIRLKATIGGTPMWQLREIRTRNGFFVQTDLAAHFGLGDATVVDSIKVEWPSGSNQVLTSVATNQYLEITEETDVPAFLQNWSVQAATGKVQIEWEVTEDASADDFRLAADCNGQQWDVQVTAGLPKCFTARDDAIQLTVCDTVTYTLHHRDADGDWHVLHIHRAEMGTPSAETKLLAASPNPFTYSTRVSFIVGSPQRVEVTVYDVAGRRVTVLSRKRPFEIGYYVITWDGRDSSGRELPSGVYMVHLDGDNTKTSQKVMILR